MIEIRIFHTSNATQGMQGGYTTYPCVDEAEAQAILDSLGKATKVASFKYDGGTRLGAVNVDHLLSVGMHTAEEVAKWEQIRKQQKDERFGTIQS